MPDIEAPKQRPVDMAPQPAYKSNKVHSVFSESLFWINPPLATLFLASHLLEPDLESDSLDSVDVSLSILDVSVSIRPNNNQLKNLRIVST